MCPQSFKKKKFSNLVVVMVVKWLWFWTLIKTSTVFLLVCSLSAEASVFWQDTRNRVGGMRTIQIWRQLGIKEKWSERVFFPWELSLPWKGLRGWPRVKNELLTHSRTLSFTHLLTHSLTHLLTYLLTHLFTHSLTYSLTHLFPLGTVIHIVSLQTVTQWTSRHSLTDRRA